MKITPETEPIAAVPTASTPRSTASCQMAGATGGIDSEHATASDARRKRRCEVERGSGTHHEGRNRRIPGRRRRGRLARTAVLEGLESERARSPSGEEASLPPPQPAKCGDCDSDAVFRRCLRSVIDLHWIQDL